MSDLISRRDLIRNISKVCGDCGIVLPDQVVDVITAQPIAYNLDAVVAEINNSENWCNAEMIYPEVAIEIVRNGGVE